MQLQVLALLMHISLFLHVSRHGAEDLQRHTNTLTHVWGPIKIIYVWRRKNAVNDKTVTSGGHCIDFSL